VRSSIVHKPDDRDSLTLAEVERMCADARKHEAPDSAEFRVVCRLTFDSPSKVGEATILWDVD
jgi:hypothetical protein